MAEISVVIPAYNCQDTLERAVLSAAKQNEISVEVIVVNDESTDGTGDVASACGQMGWCKTLDLSHSGPGAARNVGIDAATSPYVTFLDADDAFLPDSCKWLLKGAYDYDAEKCIYE